MTSLYLVVLAAVGSRALLFREDQFTDLTEECKDKEGKPINYILNEDNPALYVSIDPRHPIKSFNKRLGKVDHTKLFGNIADSGGGRIDILQDLMENKQWPLPSHNETFDCVIHIETELPKGEKSGGKYDALSLIIIELNYSSHSTRNYVEISTIGHDGKSKKRVTKKAHYSDRIWAATNPNFLLSGQLSGFDSIDYRTKVDAQHIIRPETLHSTFDKPASITVNVTKWTWASQIYMVFTSYKYLRGGHERCQESKEFDCSPPSFLSSSQDHMCMSSNLACDGLPNCGQDYLPNPDENCFKIHWSSVLLSLVSYILLAITLLLCLSCFARVLIQWSVRSSLAELRGSGPGFTSPTGSFRSSSRFFSFLGSTFSSRWERPPPTYDEAMKHVNPDIARPVEPPAYSDTVRRGANGSSGGGGGAGASVPLPSSSSATSSRPGRRSSSVGGGGGSGVGVHEFSRRRTGEGRGGGGGGTVSNSAGSGGGMVQTPPPEYDSHEVRRGYVEVGANSNNFPASIHLPPRQTPPHLPPTSASILLANTPSHNNFQSPILPTVASNAVSMQRGSSRSAEALLSSSPTSSTSSSFSAGFTDYAAQSSSSRRATRSTSSATVTATVEAEICPRPKLSQRSASQGLQCSDQI